MKPDRKVNLFNLSNHLNKNQQNSFKIHRKNIENFNFGWSHVDDADDKKIDLSDESDYRKSIFNHLQSSQQNETKTNKTALKYTTKKQKTSTFWWSHVDDADDTDHPDRSVTDTRQTTDD